jgi:hypothetical protein
MSNGNLNPQPTAASIGLGNVPDVDCTNADNITSGTLDVARLPALAYQTLVTVADQAARYALTIAQVQNGDTVQQLDTLELFLVVDDTQLNNAAGYLLYTATVNWTAINGKPQPVLDLLGVNTGNETAATIGALIAGAANKATPVDADAVGLSDSAAAGVLKLLTWANLKATLKTYFDTLYPSGSGTSTGTNTGDDKTAVSGLLKGNGATISAATSGTDYAPPTSGTAIQKGNGAGGFSPAVAGTDYCAAPSGSAIQKGNGAGALVAATPGTDYAPATSGSAVLKGNGAGGFSPAVSGTDFVGPTSGSAIQKANGTGGLTAAAAGTDFVAPNVAIAGATKTKVTYDAKGLVTGGADATTADIAEGGDLLYVTAAQRGVLLQTSGTNTGNETATSIGAIVTGAGTKATPATTDLLPLSDSAAGGIIKGLSWSNLRAALLSYFQGFFLGLPAVNGIAVRTGPTTAAARTLVPVAGLTAITDADGVNGNPIISVDLSSANFNSPTAYTQAAPTTYTPINAAVRLSGLAAGKYLVLCTSQLSNSANSQDAFIGLHAGTAGSTTLIPGAETAGRWTQQAGISASYTYELPATVFGVVTLTAGQIIEPKVKASSGSVTAYNTTITAIRIG